jgi:predicted transcriptional regulator
MKVRDLMTRTVHIIAADKSLQEAARMMRSEDIGMLPVFNGPNVQGILTDRDIVLNGVAEGLNPQRAKVTEAMSKNVITIHEDDGIETAAGLMKQHLIRRLLVVDRDRRPVGILSLGDIAARLKNPEVTEDIVHEVSEDRQGLHHS